MFKRKKGLAFLSLALCILAVVVGFLTLKTGVSSGTTLSEQHKEQVRSAITEIGLPTVNNSEVINSASENLANFIYYRSGVQLSQTNKNLLKTNEQASWNQSKLLTKEQLTQILTEIATDKLKNLTETQLSGATETLRGFNAPDLPTSFQQGRSWVKLRASGAGTMTPSEFTAQVNYIRNPLQVESRVVQSLIKSNIKLEVDKTVKVLNDSQPGFFKNSNFDLTPMQAVLISYAIVADDALRSNQTQISQRMQNIYQGITQSNNGQSYANPQGHRAYGVNGYIYSSPVDLLMDEVAVGSLITKIQERSGL